jgi:hypothetical protein
MKRRLFASISRTLYSFLPARFTNDHLFLPTTGRWLWNESQKIRQHTSKFDVKALKHVVAKTAGLEGQSSGVHLEKLAEGASNRVIAATIRRQRFIVRIPDPVVPRRLVTASEVATLEFLRAELGLPVPKVLAWNDSDDNAVGCEYMVMKEAAGQDLKSAWPSLGLNQRTAVVDQVITVQERLLEASKTFHPYGSLYFADDAVKFNFPQQIAVSATTPSKFCIGPLAHEHFLITVLSNSRTDSGPCKSLLL